MPKVVSDTERRQMMTIMISPAVRAYLVEEHRRTGMPLSRLIEQALRAMMVARQ
jgi:hypothetical protein